MRGCRKVLGLTQYPKLDQMTKHFLINPWLGWEIFNTPLYFHIFKWVRQIWHLVIFQLQATFQQLNPPQAADYSNSYVSMESLQFLLMPLLHFEFYKCCYQKASTKLEVENMSIMNSVYFHTLIENDSKYIWISGRQLIGFLSTKFCSFFFLFI